jgi:hypothetical protein
MGMHTSQRPPAEVESEAFDFMRFVRVIVSGGNHDWCFIMNMDQTLVYFSTSSKQTLDLIGNKTIHIRTSTNDTKRVTMAVTITADGTLLPSSLVFEGKSDGRIAKKEFSTYPKTHFYKCQEAAWMDEEVMITWVNEVLTTRGNKMWEGTTKGRGSSLSPSL